MTESARAVSSRRRFLGVAAGTAVGTTVSSATATASPDRTARRRSADTAVTYRWLGTSGWRIDLGAQTVLLDPYLSRFRTGLFDPPFDPSTALVVDPDRIGDIPGTPEIILVTHSHWDHFGDVPYLAGRSGARVIGTLTTYHLAQAMGVPERQLSPVRGGEVLAFDGYTVEVVAAAHSRNAAWTMAFPGVRVTVPPRPSTIADLPEGDTLAYQVRTPHGPSVFLMGASDFTERNLAGLDPDVAMIAVPTSDAVHDYVPRLLMALNHPEVVVPVHWDAFEAPLVNPPPTRPADRANLERFIRHVRSVAPRTRVLVPEYLDPYTF